MYKNLIVVGFGNLINALGGFIFLYAAAKTLNLHDFGIYSLIIAIFILSAKFTELGTTSSFVALSIKEEINYKKSLIYLKFMQTVCVAVLIFPILYFYNLLNINILVAILLGFLGYAINDYIFSIFQLFEKFELTVLTNALPSLFKALSALYILSLREVRLEQVLLLYFISLLTSALFAPLTRKLNLTRKIEVSSGIKKLAKNGFPGGISYALNLAIPAINSNAIALLGTIESVGMFSLAEKISSIFSLASNSIFTVILPKNARETKYGPSFRYKETAILSFFIIVSAGIMIVINKPVLFFLFGNKFLSSVKILNLLVISASINAITMFLDNYFYIFEKTKTLLKLNFVKIILLIILGSLFFLKMGLIGMAYANILTMIIVLFLTIRVIKDGPL